MHPDEEGFLRHMEANPGQALPALVFADWLEENGKPAHAQIIREHHLDPEMKKYHSGGIRGSTDPGLPKVHGFPVGRDNSGYHIYLNFHLPSHDYLSFFTRRMPEEGKDLQSQVEQENK